MNLNEIAQFFEITEKQARIIMNLVGCLLIILSGLLFGALVYHLIAL